MSSTKWNDLSKIKKTTLFMVMLLGIVVFLVVVACLVCDKKTQTIFDDGAKTEQSLNDDESKDGEDDKSEGGMITVEDGAGDTELTVDVSGDWDEPNTTLDDDISESKNHNTTDSATDSEQTTSDSSDKDESDSVAPDEGVQWGNPY